MFIKFILGRLNISILAIIVFSAFLILGLRPVAAQLVFPDLQTGGRLDLSASPANPRSFSYVDIILDTSSADPASSEITWFVDGKQVVSGVGIKEIRAQTGDVGSVTHINVILTKANGTLLEASLSIRPADVDLVWEVDTTVPPFYQGKPLFTLGAPVRLIAMPRLADANGRIIPAGQLVYKWTQDGRVRGLLSGYGRMSYFLDEVSPTRGESMVMVEVSTVDGTSVGIGGATLRPSSEVDILFYKHDPLLGVDFDNAIEKHFAMDEDDQELTLHAQPYFFSSVDEAQGGLEYAWFMNNRPVLAEISDVGSFLTLARNGLSGAANIEVRVKNEINFLNEAIKSLVVDFSR